MAPINALFGHILHSPHARVASNDGQRWSKKVPRSMWAR
jgi:hypothetical protein